MKARCRVCGRLTEGRGDSLCRRCWTTIPKDARGAYLLAWRKFYAGLATALDVERALHTMIDTRTPHHPRG